MAESGAQRWLVKLGRLVFGDFRAGGDSHAPEFISEIAASTASYDFLQKKRTYLRAGALEIWSGWRMKTA